MALDKAPPRAKTKQPIAQLRRAADSLRQVQRTFAPKSKAPHPAQSAARQLRQPGALIALEAHHLAPKERAGVNQEVLEALLFSGGDLAPEAALTLDEAQRSASSVGAKGLLERLKGVETKR